jgi:tetratricopeptide (TPR) repeat protein
MLVCGIYLTQSQIDTIDAKKDKYYVEKNLLVTLPTHITKHLTLGFDNLLADILWLEFIQYYGENNYLKRMTGKGYDFSYTYKYIDTITTLDPNFSYAYWFGAFAIADEMENPELAIKMLQKGIQNNPDNWWLPYTAAIMELMYNSDFEAAYTYAVIAAEIKPDYPKVQRVKTVLESKAKKKEKERAIWLQVYKDALQQGDEYTMQRAKRRLKKLGYTITEQKNEL